MRRFPTITRPRLLRKSVSVRAARTATVVSAAAVGGPVLARVRDSLVLRVVKKNKSAARSQSDEPGGR